MERYFVFYDLLTFVLILKLQFESFQAEGEVKASNHCYWILHLLRILLLLRYTISLWIPFFLSGQKFSFFRASVDLRVISKLLQ